MYEWIYKSATNHPVRKIDTTYCAGSRCGLQLFSRPVTPECESLSPHCSRGDATSLCPGDSHCPGSSPLVSPLRYAPGTGSKGPPGAPLSRSCQGRIPPARSPEPGSGRSSGLPESPCRLRLWQQSPGVWLSSEARIKRRSGAAARSVWKSRSFLDR